MREYETEKPHSTANYRGNFRGNYHSRPFYYHRRPFINKIRPNYMRLQAGNFFTSKYRKPSERQERSRSRSRSRERSRSRSSSSEKNRMQRSRRSYSRHSERSRSDSSCEEKRSASGQRTYDHRSMREHSPEHQRGSKSATSPDSVISHNKGSNSPRSRHGHADYRNSRHSRSRSRERRRSRSSSRDFSYRSQGKDADLRSSPTVSRRSDSSNTRISGEPSDSMSSCRQPHGSRIPDQTNQAQGKLPHELLLTQGALTLTGQTLPIGSMGPMFLLDPTQSTGGNSTNACNLLQKVNMATILSSTNSSQKPDPLRNHGNYMSPPLLSRYTETNTESIQPDMTVLSNGNHTDKGKHSRLDSGLSSPTLTNKLNGLSPEKISQVREKKEEIEQAYKQDCETFATVVKMLINKEPSLEDAIQPSLRQNLRDIGARCIQELQDYIDHVRKESGLK